MIIRTTLTIMFLTLSQLIYSNESERIRLTNIDFHSRDNFDFNLNDTLEKNGRLLLNYTLAGRFSINYMTDSLKSGEQVRFKIEGFDYDWINDSGCNSIMTTNLLPGRYLIRIGIFGDNQLVEEESFDLIITPPFWKTLWFKFFVTLFFFGGLLVVLIILIVNNTRLRKRLIKQ